MYPLVLWLAGAVSLLCLLVMIMMAATALIRLRALQHSGDLPSAPAERRARQLAHATLSANEFTQLRRCGYLDVVSTHFPNERRYRLPLAGGMVQVWEQHHCTGRLCLVASTPLPPYDQILALRLLITADEIDFLARANYFADYQVIKRWLTSQATCQPEVPYAR